MHQVMSIPLNFTTMETLSRYALNLDWVAVVLMLCLTALGVVRQVSNIALSDFLGVYTSSKFIKITSDDRMDNYKLLLFTGLITYPILISLVLYKLHVDFYGGDSGILTYGIILTVVSAFLLFKHYLGRLIGTVANFEFLLDQADHSRNIYRVALCFLLILLNLFIYYVFPTYEQVVLIACTTVLFVFLLYHFIIIGSLLKSIGGSILYFILYLCTLEIAPYLLLYKYFTS
ncbi:DUF4271 domain-containing protein [Nonlabens ponticola]|uniref:DUF4271 domain-containing protein n=1 Tax=Nonlabens ponticola TaxID=2496866 RepID=A0A3S9MUP2_9FLAO|nr:DUF4271 domain-containing protein [Nonlabens ponticola]AZQ42895.1 DUF4271 domain-containing protein [Nonlabens ponticola]